MSFQKRFGVGLGALLALGDASVSTAAIQIERSGNTFHIAACSRAISPGIMRCFAHIKTDARGNIFDAKPNAVSTTPPAGLSPADLKSAYKIAGAGTSAMTIAIVDAYGYTNAEVDLAVYRKQFGLPACTTNNHCFRKVNQNGVQGSYPRMDVGWAQESALDVDMASAACPNCKILLVQANAPTGADLAAAVNTAIRLGAQVVSNSYGGSEIGSESYEPNYDHAGVAITASSGDNGYGAQFPAASPHVIAVGGTTLTRASNGRGWTESAWAGSGSGCSQSFGKPAWQTDSLCSNRSIADVSAVADPSTGVAVYGPRTRTAAGWMVIGGTSASAPFIAGLYGVNGGVPNYAADLYAHSGALFDVTSGSNGSCAGTYICTAGVGYDGPTGLGSPNGTTAF